MSWRRFRSGLVELANPATVSYRTSTSSNTNGTSFTFSSQDIGTAAADRRVVVCITSAGSGAPSLSSLTVGGVTATTLRLFQATGRSCSFLIASVPTGTTGDVVATYSSTQDRCGIGIWATYGVLSATPIDSQVVTASSSSVSIPSLTTIRSGLAFAGNLATTNNPTHSWSNVTERWDTSFGEGSDSFSGGEATTDGSAVSISATLSTSALHTATAVCIR